MYYYDLLLIYTFLLHSLKGTNKVKKHKEAYMQELSKELTDSVLTMSSIIIAIIIKYEYCDMFKHCSFVPCKGSASYSYRIIIYN